LVASKLSGLEKGIIPPAYPLLTAGIDIGKTALHWCVVAWCNNASGSVIEYGVEDVWPSNRDNDRAVEQAILQALFRLRDKMLSAEYHTPDGEIHQLKTCLVDSGWKEKPVYEFVRSTGQTTFKASKGFGETVDGRKSYFRIPEKQSNSKRVGEHCFLAHHPAQGIWLVGMDADYWKSWLHQRFMTPSETPGSLTLFGNDKRDHISYAHHICAEIEVEEFVPEKGLKRYWKKVNRNNHWLDTTYMACVAASLHGTKLLDVAPEHAAHRKRTRKQQNTRLLQRQGGWVRGMR